MNIPLAISLGVTSIVIIVTILYFLFRVINMKTKEEEQIQTLIKEKSNKLKGGRTNGIY